MEGQVRMTPWVVNAIVVYIYIYIYIYIYKYRSAEKKNMHITTVYMVYVNTIYTP